MGFINIVGRTVGIHWIWFVIKGGRNYSIKVLTWYPGDATTSWFTVAIHLHKCLFKNGHYFTHQRCWAAQLMSAWSLLPFSGEKPRQVLCTIHLTVWMKWSNSSKNHIVSKLKEEKKWPGILPAIIWMELVIKSLPRKTVQDPIGFTGEF